MNMNGVIRRSVLLNFLLLGKELCFIRLVSWSIGNDSFKHFVELSREQSRFFIGGAFGASGIEVDVGTGLAGWCAVICHGYSEKRGGNEYECCNHEMMNVIKNHAFVCKMT